MVQFGIKEIQHVYDSKGWTVPIQWQQCVFVIWVEDLREELITDLKKINAGNSQESPISSSPSSSCECLASVVSLTLIPLTSNTFKATLAALSMVFFVFARILRCAPNACALITATVPVTGVGPGEGDLWYAWTTFWHWACKRAQALSSWEPP